MGLFSKTATDYIRQIIDLAHKTRDSISRGNTDDAKRFLHLILKFDKKEFLKLDDETGAKELTDRCVYIHVLADEALAALERGHSDKTKELLDRITDIENNEILAKIKGYIDIKEELRRRKFDVDRIADGKGYGMDPLIKPLVATLKYFGLETDQSCHGHTDHGEAHPWVRLKVDYRNGNDAHFKDFVKTVQEYNLNSRIQWMFKKLGNESSLASSVAVIRVDRREFTNDEVQGIMDFCRQKIRENRFSLACGNTKNFQISVVAASGQHHDDLLKIKPLIAERFMNKGYEVDISIPKDEYHPDTYYLEASGGTLEDMQRDIIHFSDYIINNFQRPKP